MSAQFVKGQEYSRAEVQRFVGGNAQAGIFYAASGPSIAVLDVVHRRQATGYANVWLTPDVFEYAGQGLVGDQELTGANERLLQHAEDGRDLYLFTQLRRGGVLRFDGEMVVEDCQPRRVERNGRQDRVYFFRLRRVESIEVAVENMLVTEVAADLPLAELRKRAQEAAHVPKDDAQRRLRNIYRRAYDVSAYVLARAGGVCEGGGEPAPFIRADGRPYLEAHHIDKVGDGGPDAPDRVIALCPNCHRRAHFGVDAVSLNSTYRQIVADKEAEMNQP